MKWDYAKVTVWGLDGPGPDVQDMFSREVATLAQRLEADIEDGSHLDGYQQGFQITRKGEVLVKCLTAGTGDAQGSSCFVAASTAAEVYPILQDMFPRHSVARLDACEDYVGPGTWDRLEAMLTRLCRDYRVSMSPFGEGHIRPDGTRDSTKGRTWYCGSKSSPFRVVLYEKGLQQLAKGVPDDPTHVRLEVRVKPSSKVKAQLGAMSLKPSDLLSMSGWGMELGRLMGVEGLERLNIGSVWKPSEIEQTALKVVRMFDRGLDHLLAELGTPEAVGRLLFQVKEKADEARDTRKEQRAVSTF